MRSKNGQACLVYVVLGVLLLTILIWGAQEKASHPRFSTGRLLARIEGQGLSDPDWSPDGSGIVVRDRAYWDQWEPASLQYIDVETGNVRVLREASSTGLDQPNWTADGTAVLFVQGCSVMAVDIWTGDETEVGSGCSIAPSPQGQRFATQLSAEESGVTTVVARTWGPETAPDRVLFERQPSAAGYVEGMDWSSTGLIAISYCPDGCASQDRFALYVVNESGELLASVDHGQEEKRYPKWSRDGEWIAYISSPTTSANGSRTVAITSPDGQCTIDVVTANDITGVDWSPAGDALAVTLSDELWILSLEDTLGLRYAELWQRCN